jgi:hypothetical protein
MVTVMEPSLTVLLMPAIRGQMETPLPNLYCAICASELRGERPWKPLEGMEHNSIGPQK